ncbi:TPA: hypothetical protein NJG56_003913 [Pseudomonas aeruginosa]|nr:hypothetical protein [Pseudomonas aeruginosa]
MRSKLFLLFFCLLLSGGRLFAVEAHPSLTLFSQLRIEHEDMAIAEDDWAWLRHKGHLRLGAALDETSPFNVRLDDENYEGITADVATLVGQLLGMLRESEINQEGKARKLWDIEEGKGI